MLNLLKNKIEEFGEYLSGKFLGPIDALQWHEWDQWDDEQKKNHPIAFFLIDRGIQRIPGIIERWTRDVVYSLKAKYITKEYQFVKIDVQRFETNDNSYDKYKLNHYGYRDSLDIMLSANFQILVDYVETEAFIIAWESSTHSELWTEISALYEWWTVGRNIERAANKTPAPVDYGITRSQLSEYNQQGIVPDGLTKQPFIDYNNASRKSSSGHDKLEERDDEMLQRLVKIRRNLWT